MWDLSFSALNEDSGFWPRLQRRCYGGFRRLSGLSQRFWLSRAYFPFLLWVALGFAALRQPVYGAMALLGICIWLLVFCRDLLASVTPFLLVFLLSTQRYESLGDFLPCAVLAAPFWSTIEHMPEDEKRRMLLLRQRFPSMLINGPFSILVGFTGGMMALNDRLKLRSMVVAETEDMAYVASEECAIRRIAPDVTNVWAPRGGQPVIFTTEGGRA